MKRGIRARWSVFICLLFMATAAWAQLPAFPANTPNLADLMANQPEQQKFLLTQFNIPKLQPSATLELERFKVFADDLVVYDGNKKIDIRPQALYFKGKIQGVPGSRVILSRYQDGRMRGFVFADAQSWLLTRPLQGTLQARVLSTQELDALRPQALELDDMRLPTITSSEDTPPTTAALPAYAYTARVAVETDYEYYSRFNDSTAALDYIGELFAYASSIYETEVNTRLLVHWTRLWTTGANNDPWNATSSSTMLDELRNYWNNWTSAPDRSIVHLLSGKSTGGGIAYVGVLCVNGWDYGLVGNITGGFDINNPAPMWDILAVAHEIGHNFNSPHTHEYCNIPNSGDPLIDRCYSPCDGGSTGLPGPSGSGSGTIMSYCHLFGYSNVTMTFGRPDGVNEFQYGNSPGRVPDLMSAHVVQRANANPQCLEPYYLLSVTPPSNGRITSDITGIDCGSDCKEDYAQNTQVTLTATPSPGYFLSQWTGACSGQGTCTLIMNGSYTVGAIFSPTASYTLSVQVTGHGSVTGPGIDCGLDCSEIIAENTLVTLSANPEAGHALVSWGGACSGSGTTCQVTMDAAKTVTAEFTRQLTITKSGSGNGTVSGAGLDCGSICTVAIAENTPVSLQASANVGSLFNDWSSPCAGAGPSCNFTMSGDMIIDASFVLSYDLTAALPSNGRIQSSDGKIACPGDCTETYPEGTQVTLSAMPDSGYAFSSWNGDCTGTGSCDLLMSSNHSVGASFVPLYRLTVTLSGNGSVTPTPAGASCGTNCWEFAAGTQVSILATADANHVFSGWTGNAACTTANPCVLTMNANQALTANFTPEYRLNVSLLGNGNGQVVSNDNQIQCPSQCEATYGQGAQVTLNATANPGSQFLGWTGGGCSGTGSCTVTLNSNVQIDALFQPLYTVSLTVTGNGRVDSTDGSIQCGSQCRAEYAEGESIALQPIPDPNESHLSWDGACAGFNPSDTCTLTITGNTQASAAFSFPFSLDVDTSLGDGTGLSSLNDGLLIYRYLLGLRGNDLVSGITTSDPALIESQLDSALAAGYLDIDGSGQTELDVDAVLILRHLFGLENNALIDGLPCVGGCDLNLIQYNLQQLMP